MEHSLPEVLHEIAAHTPKQEACEIISILLPLEAELEITVSNYFILTHDNTPEFGHIPLDNIHVVIMTDDHVFLLCRNDVIHCFDRWTCCHQVILPDDDKPCFREMLLMVCESYLERWRMGRGG